MKTPVRIQYSNSIGYEIMHIEILVPRFGGNDIFEPAGTITFQRSTPENYWYGMSFNISTDRILTLKKFTKLAEFVAKNSNWDSQPADVLKLIGADEHRIFNNDFVSVSKMGQNTYKMIVNGSHYKNIIADSYESAEKQMKKHKIPGARIEFSGVVVM
jgi:hypothetical protein